jgi:hypothetical protein
MKTPFRKTPGQRSRAGAGHAGASANMMKKRTSPKKILDQCGPSEPVSHPLHNILGCRIQPGWREGNGPVTQWKGTVLDQVPKNPSLYLIKYEGFDCAYGLELNKDERVSALEVLPDRVATSRISGHDDWKSSRAHV